MAGELKVKARFGEHYELNRPLFDPMNNVIQKIYVSMKENIETAVCEAILEEAKARGITDWIVLDKKRIMSALGRTIPKEANYTAPGIFCCPTCWNDELTAGDKHCKNCGQALEW